MEILRLHYAMTLRHWRRRFRGAWHTAAEKFGERFCRMWEMYLTGSETAFRYQNLTVFQLQLTKDQNVLRPATTCLTPSGSCASATGTPHPASVGRAASRLGFACGFAHDLPDVHRPDI